VPLYDVRIDKSTRRSTSRARSRDLGREEQEGGRLRRRPGRVQACRNVKDKDSPLIFAATGGECWKSYKLSVWAQKPGYRTFTGSARLSGMEGEKPADGVNDRWRASRSP